MCQGCRMRAPPTRKPGNSTTLCFTGWWSSLNQAFTPRFALVTRYSPLLTMHLVPQGGVQDSDGATNSTLKVGGTLSRFHSSELSTSAPSRSSWKTPSSIARPIETPGPLGAWSHEPRNTVLCPSPPEPALLTSCFLFSQKSVTAVAMLLMKRACKRLTCSARLRPPNDEMTVSFGVKMRCFNRSLSRTAFLMDIWNHIAKRRDVSVSNVAHTVNNAHTSRITASASQA
mmetsp:Transcript_11310/g.32314  ORF Transcript_11310/g.32314 Transcript_11310/m.32314 type:complete len:229 (+) Transcript_11310:1444-2130(+)